MCYIFATRLVSLLERLQERLLLNVVLDLQTLHGKKIVSSNNTHELWNIVVVLDKCQPAHAQLSQRECIGGDPVHEHVLDHD